MSKRNRPTRIDPINLPRRLREGLTEAGELLEDKKPVQAKTILEELVKHFPRQEDALGLFANACLDTKDQRGYLQTLLKLYSLHPNNPEYNFGLAGGYLSNGYIVLAMQTFECLLERWPGHPKADDARKAIELIREGLDNVLGELRMEEKEALAFSAKHDELRICLDTGQFQRGKSLAKELLRVKPDFAPARNNLSQIYWLEGDNEKAIASCREVLALEPDNIHALSNIIRLLYLTGRKDESPAYMARLKESKAEAADRWKKIAEALSFIGDDQGMLELKAQAQKEARPGELDEYYHHFMAVSEMILGQEKEARDDWKYALKLQPGFPIAKENLDDLKLAKHKQNGPWAHTMGEMVSEKTIRELTVVVQRASKNNNAFRSTVQRFLSAHPEILQLAPLILERGEPIAKELILNVADMSAHPEFLALLKKFAFGQSGSDKMRLGASQILSKHNAAPNGLVEMWLDGEWKQMLLLGFEITPEPMLDVPLKPRVLDLMIKGIHALHEEDGVMAEQYYRKALDIQPEIPNLLNNLAMALAIQGKKKESDSILDHIIQDFPDYFFGQMSLARKSIQAKDYEKANSILTHWMQTKKKYHVTEYNMLCKTEIDLLIAEEKIEGALSWLDMWERTEPDDPDFGFYKSRLGLLRKTRNLFKPFRSKGQK